MKTWISTVLTTPVIHVPLFFLIDPETVAPFPFFGLLFFLVFVGFAISIPSLLLLGLVANVLEKKIRETKKLKAATISISILLVIGSVVFFSSDFEGKELSAVIGLAIAYIVSILSFGSYYKIKMG